MYRCRLAADEPRSEASVCALSGNHNHIFAKLGLLVVKSQRVEFTASLVVTHPSNDFYEPFIPSCPIYAALFADVLRECLHLDQIV